MFKRLLLRLFPQNKALKQSQDAFVPMTDDKGNVIGMMDLMTRDYLESNAPMPSQLSLDAMLGQCTRVQLMRHEGSTTGTGKIVEKQVIEIRDVESIISLRKALAIDEENQLGHLMMVGRHRLKLFNGTQSTGTIELLAGFAIRWDHWSDDVRLQDPMHLLTWLAERGVGEPLERYREMEGLRAAEQQAEIRWKEAIPDCLLPYWEEMLDSRTNLESLRQALEAAYPDPALRVLALFRWFGSGAGPWSGFPDYEFIPEALLLEYPTATLISILTQSMLTSTDLDGAARYFAGWQFRNKEQGGHRQIPPEFRQQLLDHSLRSSFDDNIQRAKRAFSA